ncbi:MAG TPA: hypothetical protein DCP92_01315 [Nitrospiraceae bacterium]|nr:hypothetical protein [Nitrospiraceae bacterium]
MADMGMAGMGMDMGIGMEDMGIGMDGADGAHGGGGVIQLIRTTIRTTIHTIIRNRLLLRRSSLRHM